TRWAAERRRRKRPTGLVCACAMSLAPARAWPAWPSQGTAAGRLPLFTFSARGGDIVAEKGPGAPDPVETAAGDGRPPARPVAPEKGRLRKGKAECLGKGRSAQWRKKGTNPRMG